MNNTYFFYTTTKQGKKCETDIPEREKKSEGVYLILSMDAIKIDQVFFSFFY